MCLNPIKILNKYNNREYVVNCGRCPVCLQQKADSRAKYLRMIDKQGLQAYFITLTYANEFVPYVCFHELPFNMPFTTYDDFSINVYRNENYNFSKDKVDNYNSLIYSKYIEYDSSDIAFDVKSLFHFFEDDKIGVLLYKDVQNFFKRLRYYCDVRFYAVAGEYGSSTLRPHWHILLYTDNEITKDQISDIWHFGFVRVETPRSVESYLSSYINSSANTYHPFLKRFFPQKFVRSYCMKENFAITIDKIYSDFILMNTTKHKFSFIQFNKYHYREIFLPAIIMNYYFPCYRLYKYIYPLDFYNLLLTNKDVCLFDVKNIYKSTQLHNLEIFNHLPTMSYYKIFIRFAHFAKLLNISVLDYIFFAFDYVKRRSLQPYKEQYFEHGFEFFLSFDIDIYNYFLDDFYNFCKDFNCPDSESLKYTYDKVKNLTFEDFMLYFCNDDFYFKRFFNLDKFHKVSNSIFNLTLTNNGNKKTFANPSTHSTH